MSLEQANAFYRALITDPILYAQYLSHCSYQRALNAPAGRVELARQWDETQILSFATKQGFNFSLGDLYQVWFGQHDYRSAHMEQVGWKLGTLSLLRRQLA